MSTKMVRQTMFTTGEVDVQVYKRTESDAYLTAAQSLLNAEVGTTGLAKKRKGTSLLYNVSNYAQFNSHMYDFTDKYGNHYLLLTADSVIYVFSTPADQIHVVTSRGNHVVTSNGFQVVALSDQLNLVTPIKPVPYQTGDLDNIDYTQDNDSVIFTHPNYPPARVYIKQYNGASPPTFEYKPLDIYPYPAYDFNDVNYSQFAVTISGNTITFKNNASGATSTGFDDSWVNGQIVGPGNGSTDLTAIAYGVITNVDNSVTSQTTFTLNVQIPFATAASAGSQFSVKKPVWGQNTPGSYPAKVAFYQSRLWFANAGILNNTVFGSKINQPINFDVGTGRDTDAIVYTLGQTESGAILWLNGGKQLEIFSENYEFACPQDTNSALTPSTFSIRQQSSYGSSPYLKPVTYINDSYYVTKSGKAFINYHYNGIGLTYSSSNISAASSHLVKSPVNRALLRGSDTSQDNFIYFLNDSDDTITAFQFASEYKLAALSPITFQRNVQLLDICTVNNSVYILKYYQTTNQYTVEAFDDDVRIDCNFATSMPANGNIQGLVFLEGFTVQVLYQGQDFGQYTVKNGEITVNNPQGIADTVQIGLLYDVTITPMYPFSGQAESAFKKKVTRIYVDYYNTIDFSINGYLVPYQTYAQIQENPILEPQTGTAIVGPYQGYHRFGNMPTLLSITQTSPFDLQILSIGYQITSAVI